MKKVTTISTQKFKQSLAFILALLMFLTILPPAIVAAEGDPGLGVEIIGPGDDNNGNGGGNGSPGSGDGSGGGSGNGNGSDTGQTGGDGSNGGTDNGQPPGGTNGDGSGENGDPNRSNDGDTGSIDDIGELNLIIDPLNLPHFEIHGPTPRFPVVTGTSIVIEWDLYRQDGLPSTVAPNAVIYRIFRRQVSESPGQGESNFTATHFQTNAGQTTWTDNGSTLGALAPGATYAYRIIAVANGEPGKPGHERHVTLAAPFSQDNLRPTITQGTTVPGAMLTWRQRPATSPGINTGNSYNIFRREGTWDPDNNKWVWPNWSSTPLTLGTNLTPASLTTTGDSPNVRYTWTDFTAVASKTYQYRVEASYANPAPLALPVPAVVTSTPSAAFTVSYLPHGPRPVLTERRAGGAIELDIRWPSPLTPVRVAGYAQSNVRYNVFKRQLSTSPDPGSTTNWTLVPGGLDLPSTQQPTLHDSVIPGARYEYAIRISTEAQSPLPEHKGSEMGPLGPPREILVSSPFSQHELRPNVVMGDSILKAKVTWRVDPNIALPNTPVSGITTHFAIERRTLPAGSWIPIRTLGRPDGPAVPADQKISFVPNTFFPNQRFEWTGSIIPGIKYEYRIIARYPNAQTVTSEPRAFTADLPPIGSRAIAERNAAGDGINIRWSSVAVPGMTDPSTQIGYIIYHRQESFAPNERETEFSHLTTILPGAPLFYTDIPGGGVERGASYVYAVAVAVWPDSTPGTPAAMGIPAVPGTISGQPSLPGPRGVASNAVSTASFITQDELRPTVSQNPLNLNYLGASITWRPRTGGVPADRYYIERREQNVNGTWLPSDWLPLAGMPLEQGDADPPGTSGADFTFDPATGRFTFEDRASSGNGILPGVVYDYRIRATFIPGGGQPNQRVTSSPVSSGPQRAWGSASLPKVMITASVDTTGTPFVNLTINQINPRGSLNNNQIRYYVFRRQTSLSPHSHNSPHHPGFQPDFDFDKRLGSTYIPGSSTQVTYQDKTVARGASYQYTVRAVLISPTSTSPGGVYMASPKEPVGTTETSYRKNADIPTGVANVTQASLQPTVLTAQSTHFSATIQWTSATPAQNYFIQRRTLVDGVWSDWIHDLGYVLSPSNTTTTMTWVDRRVEPETVYQYRIVGTYTNGIVITSLPSNPGSGASPGGWLSPKLPELRDVRAVPATYGGQQGIATPTAVAISWNIEPGDVRYYVRMVNIIGEQIGDIVPAVPNDTSTSRFTHIWTGLNYEDHWFEVMPVYRNPYNNREYPGVWRPAAPPQGIAAVTTADYSDAEASPGLNFRVGARNPGAIRVRWNHVFVGGFSASNYLLTRTDQHGGRSMFIIRGSASAPLYEFIDHSGQVPWNKCAPLPHRVVPGMTYTYTLTPVWNIPSSSDFDPADEDRYLRSRESEGRRRADGSFQFARVATTRDGNVPVNFQIVTDGRQHTSVRIQWDRVSDADANRVVGYRVELSDGRIYPLKVNEAHPTCAAALCPYCDRLIPQPSAPAANNPNDPNRVVRYTIDNLKPNTTYFVTVHAVWIDTETQTVNSVRIPRRHNSINQLNIIDHNIAAFRSAPFVFTTRGSAPRNLRIAENGLTPTSAILEWTRPDIDANITVSYRLFKDGVQIFPNPATSTLSHTTDRRFEDFDLRPGIPVRYSVQAFFGPDFAPGNTIELVVTPPGPAPSNLRVSQAANARTPTSISVSWGDLPAEVVTVAGSDGAENTTADPSRRFVHWRVYRYCSEGNVLVGIVPRGDNIPRSFTVGDALANPNTNNGALNTSLAPDTMYTIRVVGVWSSQSAGGGQLVEGAVSAINISTTAPAPTNVNSPANTRQPTQFELRWTPIPDAQLGPNHSTNFLGYRIFAGNTDVTPEGALVRGNSTVIRGLSPNTMYPIRVYGEWATGTVRSFGGANISTTGPAPRNLRVSGLTNTSVRLEWEGVGGADGYRIHGNGRVVGDSTGSFFVDTNLTPGVPVSYRVQAFWGNVEDNNVGTLSAARSVTPRGPAPGGFKASTITPTSIKLNWSHMAANARISEFLGYNIYVDDKLWNEDGPVNFDPNSRVKPEITIDTGLTPNTRYQIRIAGVWASASEINPAREGLSATINTRTNAPAPARIQAPNATRAHDNFVVTWNHVPIAARNGDFQGYHVYVGTDDNNKSIRVTGDTPVDGPDRTVSLLVEGLSPNTTYPVRVVGVWGNDVESTAGYGTFGAANLSTHAPAPSSLRRVGRANPTFVDMEWRWNNINSPVGFLVYKNGLPYRWVDDGSTRTRDPNMVPGIPARYMVQAFWIALPAGANIDSNGFVTNPQAGIWETHRTNGGALSRILTVNPPGNAPGNVRTPVREATRIRVEWRRPAGNVAGAKIEGYKVELGHMVNTVTIPEGREWYEFEYPTYALRPNTDYHVRVTVLWRTGTGADDVFEGRTATFNTSTRSPAPQNLRIPTIRNPEPGATPLYVRDMTGTSIRLQWDSVDGAFGYKIYRNRVELDDIAGFPGFKINQTTFVDREVVPGQNVSYTVRAFWRINGLDILGDPSSTLTVNVSDALNARRGVAPRNVAATATTTEATVTWGAVEDIPKAEKIYGYKFEVRRDGRDIIKEIAISHAGTIIYDETGKIAKDIDGNPLPIPRRKTSDGKTYDVLANRVRNVQIQGLAPNTRYHVRVTPVWEISPGNYIDGTASNFIPFITTGVAPGRPSQVAGSLTHTSVRLRWDPVLDHDVVGYMIFKNSLPIGYLTTQEYKLQNNSWLDTRLQPGAEVRYTVRAFWTPPTLVGSIIPMPETEPDGRWIPSGSPGHPSQALTVRSRGSAPGGIKHVSHSPTEITISWNAVTTISGTAAVESYHVELWRDGKQVGDALTIPANRARVAGFTDLDPNTDYQVRVIAEFTGNLHSAPGTINIKTDGPAPGTPAVVAGTLTNTSLRLTWAPVRAINVQGYLIYRNNLPVDYITKADYLLNNNSWQDNSLTPGQRVTYSVRACWDTPDNANQGGTGWLPVMENNAWKVSGQPGALSRTRTVTPPGLSPRSVRVVANSPTSFTVFWDHVPGAEFYRVTAVHPNPTQVNSAGKEIVVRNLVSPDIYANRANGVDHASNELRSFTFSVDSTNPVTGTTIPYFVDPFTRYRVTVAAIWGAEGDTRNPGPGKTVNFRTPGPAPARLRRDAQAFAHGEVRLIWNPVNLAGVQGYVIFKNNVPVDAITKQEYMNNNNSWTDPSPNPGVRATYRVRAYWATEPTIKGRTEQLTNQIYLDVTDRNGRWVENGQLGASSNNLNVTLTHAADKAIGAAPRNVTARALSPTAMRVTWGALSGVDGYVIRVTCPADSNKDLRPLTVSVQDRRSLDIDSALIERLGSLIPGFDSEGLYPNVEYRVTVTGMWRGGEGRPSQVVRVRMPGPAPRNLRVFPDSLTHENLRLTWDWDWEEDNEKDAIGFLIYKNGRPHAWVPKGSGEGQYCDPTTFKGWEDKHITPGVRITYNIRAFWDVPPKGFANNEYEFDDRGIWIESGRPGILPRTGINVTPPRAS